MDNIGIFYGSSVGTTKRIVRSITKQIPSDTFNIDGNVNKINEFNNLIFATSTWGQGDLQEDFLNNLDEIKKIDFSNKKVALLGVGDQSRYPETFVKGISTLRDIIKENNGTIIGFTSLEGYSFNNDSVIENNKLIGLAIDQVSQKDLTEPRISQWCHQLKLEF